LVKREEQIVVKDLKINKKKLFELDGRTENTKDFILINLPRSSASVKLLQRIRDESHRFAVSYHTVLKRTKQIASLLDEIPGIGPKTRYKLIRKFGSIRNLKMVDESDIVSIIGPAKANLVITYLKAL
jgi:excinuclease ABC subunit C